jgi:hypothetical protein
MGPVKIVAMDPGESFGYCGGVDNELQFAGSVDMWEFVHALGRAAGVTPDWAASSGDEVLGYRLEGTQQVVIEDWALYPWALANHALDWDKCRTARAIGAVEYICRTSGIPYVLQGAKIKDTAQAAGVEELYLTPRHENRHANDAMQHYVFFNLKRGLPPVRWVKEEVGV